ncbi:Uncharacterized protein TCM_042398 isoform 3 [Theobroma cacao]|uniref:Uncharacterized protein isoform 3 n=1 Tax=Theobroma cacao TaxID=3641 RepID=A0A061FST6_THECC|nr:Uncharacterized protein TCM_042398 isoform 3 [Theobroma cacao]
MKGIMETFFHGLSLGFTIVRSFVLALYTFNSVVPLFVPIVNPPQPAPNLEILPVPAPMPDHPLKQFSVLPLIPKTKQMIVLEWLFLTITPCDAAEPWQLGFQDATTLMMQGIIDLHHDIFFFLILILVFVLRIFVRALWHFHYHKNPTAQKIVHGTTIEILQTIFSSIIPMFIAIPSFALLYSMDEAVISISIQREGVDYGQCSEICGTNHAFKPPFGNRPPFLQVNKIYTQAKASIPSLKVYMNYRLTKSSLTLQRPLSKFISTFMAALQHSWLSTLNTTAFFSSSNRQKNSPFKLSFSQKPNSEETSPESAEGPVDPVKLPFERAKAYKKMKVNPDSKTEPNPGEDSGRDRKKTDGSKEIPASVKVALRKAREYKENTGVLGGVDNASESRIASGKNTESGGTSQLGKTAEKKVQKEEKLLISSIDFVGLEFADKKKSRGLPAGLAPVSDPFPEGDLPDVEIIVGDTSKFGEATTSEEKQTTEDSSEIYKPKVSTWGVFPRPGNISKTFGGGRTIRPGEVLESEEDKAAKNERTRQLLTAYKKKIGLNVDPKLRSECEKALKDGDSLMDSGKLKEALSCYERVMEKMPYQSELHGFAALQWSICQDSLRRYIINYFNLLEH